MRAIFAALTILALTACASTGRVDPAYAAYVQAQDRAQQHQAQQLAAIADASACNGDPTCVAVAKGYAAIVAAVTGNRAQLAPPPRKVHWSESFRNIANGLTPIGQIVQGIEGIKANVDIARIGAEREVGMANAWAGVATGVADAFARQPPSTYVGRDLISGTQHIGDWVGRDNAGRDQRTGDDIRRDTIGRDRTDWGSGNRFDSPGPWRDNGDRCTGDQCQGGDRFPLPPVEPPTDG